MIAPRANPNEVIFDTVSPKVTHKLCTAWVAKYFQVSCCEKAKRPVYEGFIALVTNTEVKGDFAYVWSWTLVFPRKVSIASSFT